MTGHDKTEEEPSGLIYFKVYKIQIPVIEKACATAARTLWSETARSNGTTYYGGISTDCYSNGCGTLLCAVRHPAISFSAWASCAGVSNFRRSCAAPAVASCFSTSCARTNHL